MKTKSEPGNVRYSRHGPIRSYAAGGSVGWLPGRGSRGIVPDCRVNGYPGKKLPDGQTIRIAP